MSERERRPGHEPSAAHERGGEEGRTDRAADLEARAEAAERNALAETAGEKREAKERIADVLWEKPKQFVERVVANKIAPYFRRFLGKFSELDDEAMATDRLKQARDAAASAKGGSASGGRERIDQTNDDGR